MATISKKIGTNGVYTMWLDVAENSTSTTANTSNVTVTLKAKRNDGYPSYGAYNLTANNTVKLTVGGSVRVNTTTAKIDLRTSTGVTLATWTGNVSHNSDGTLSLPVEGYFYFNTSAASSLPKGGYTVSGSAALTTIPRKSSVSCTDANVGSTAMILINRASSGFTHTLTYAFGGLSGTIATKTASTSVGWTLPESFYAKMPKRTLDGTVTCETFNGSTSLGATSCSFTATAIDMVTVGGTVVDTNATTIALTGDASKLVRYYSTAKATITAATNHSATIAKKTINNTSVTSELTVAKCEVPNFAFYAADSRDYSVGKTVPVEMVPYIKLTNNATIKRKTPTGNILTLSLSGNYYNGSFGKVSNTLTCRYRSKISGGSFGSWTSVTATKSGNTYSYTVEISGYAYDDDYVFDVEVSDALMTPVKTINVPRGVPVFDWGKNDFNFNVPTTINGDPVPTICTGTWTPSLDGATGYASRSGSYLKIGNLVYLHCDVQITGISATATAATGLIIRGIPFVPTARTALTESFDYCTANPQAALVEPQNFIRLTINTTSGWSTIMATQVTSKFRVIISGCYMT